MSRTRKAIWYGCEHRTRTQISVGRMTSSTHCLACMKRRTSPLVRMIEALRQLEQGERDKWGKLPDETDQQHPRLRAYRRLLRRIMASRAPWGLDIYNAIEGGRTWPERTGAHIRVKSHYTLCPNCTKPAWVSTWQLPRTKGDTLAGCRNCFPQTIPVAQARLAAKFPETQWTLYARRTQ